MDFKFDNEGNRIWTAEELVIELDRIRDEEEKLYNEYMARGHTGQLWFTYLIGEHDYKD
jgi:hypothetical protein